MILCCSSAFPSLRFSPKCCHSPSEVPSCAGAAAREGPQVATKISVQFSSVAQSCPTLRDPMDCSPPGSSVHSLLQGIFPTQGSNPGLLHCRQILYHLSHQGSPMIPASCVIPFPGVWTAYTNSFQKNRRNCGVWLPRLGYEKMAAPISGTADCGAWECQ